MYLNRVSLIGFLGKTPTAYNAGANSYVLLSLATKSSYKDKKSSTYVSQTEWHRCIVWGKLADYAKTLHTGAHLAVEGQLRSHDRTNQKTGKKERVWEVRVSSILKLDRAEKAGPEENGEGESNPEEDAA